MSAGVSEETLSAMLALISDPYMQMHTGDPGGDGTSNVSSVTTRVQVDFVETAPGVLSLNVPVEWPDVWDGDEQIITHLSAWDASSAGNFVFSVALVSPVKVINGIVPRISSLAVVVPTFAKD